MSSTMRTASWQKIDPSDLEWYDSMVYYTMEQLHSMCGCEYQLTSSSMAKHMETFIEWKAKRKLERVNKKTASAAADAAVDDEESDEDDDDEVEVEVEANDEVEVDD
jgi:hypothetical protein